MNSKDYISSGILELYAMDLLSNEERNEVVVALKKHPELALELEKIELALEQYAEGFKRKPSAQLKEKVLASLAEEKPVIPIKRNNQTSKLVAVAATILLLISVGVNVYQDTKLKQTEEQLDELIAEKTYLTEENNKVKLEYENSQEKLELFQSPDVQNIIIKGSELSPESYAIVSFNTKNKSVSISGINLPENSEEYQYQLWALVDGNPVDLGVFDSSDSLKKLVKTVDNPDAFAVTLQDRGGNEKPNLEKLYLIGNV